MTDLSSSGFTLTRTEQQMKDLILEMRSGDSRREERAMKIFYRELYQKLRWSRQARLYDVQTVDDAFQETMTAVWKGLASYRGESAIFSWVYGIFDKKLVDQLRKAKPDETIHLDDAGWNALESSHLGVVADSAEALSRSQVQSFLHTCIEKLKKKAPHLAFVIGHYHRGLSVEEIAMLEARPSGTIKTWASEAYKKLLPCMRSQGASGIQG